MSGRYWVQGDYAGFDEVKGFKVYLKTDKLSRAINKMKRSTREVFIWDCWKRYVVDANYNCNIMGGD